MSGAATMRNAVKRITHKERAQPHQRKKLGLLEKHKDYIVRAKHHHKKKDYMKALKNKAADRNPDEFYYKMNSTEVKGGIHKDIDNGSLDTETVKLLKTQDLGYLVHKAAKDTRKIEKLRNNLHMIGDEKPKSHQIFVDTTDELEEFDLEEHFDTAPELVDRTYNRPRKETLEKGIYVGSTDEGAHITRKRVRKALEEKEKSYDELNKRIKRSEKLQKTAQCLLLQRNLMGKGSKKKLANAEQGKAAVFKWKRVRAK
jgi:U3 small nucleolar RNA-associated protein 11